MKHKSLLLSFFLSGTLLFAQSALRLKIQADSLDGNVREDPVVHSRRLPPNARTHVILQFDQPPSAETIAELTARGARVLQDIPDYGLLVSTTGMVPLSDLGIRLAGRLDPREKVSPLITRKGGSEAGSYYLVEFHPDVDPSAARRLLLNMGLELSEHPDLAPHHLMVHLWNPAQASETFALLATEDPVAYIFPASEDLAAGSRTPAYTGAFSALGPVGQYVATNGDGWDGPGRNSVTLNYVLNQMTEKLPTGTPQAEILRAMAEWSKVIQLDWQPGASPTGNHTINVLFASGAHGDSFPFDGAGGVLAHTFYPAPLNPEPIAGDMHCDDSENWNVGATFDVFSVVLHELGHALGLGHSDNPGAVMYPYYKMVSTLADDDKQAILTLYAARTGTAPAPAPAPLALTMNAAAATTTLATVSLSGSVTGGSGTPAVTWALSTSASGAATLSGANWLISSIPLATGLNTITVTAADITGSISQTISVTRQVPPAPAPAPAPAPVPPLAGTDKTAPTLAIAYPSTSYITTLASLTFRGSASDASGIASVTWSTNTGGAGMATGTTAWSAAIPLLVGSNQVIIRATDTAGNTSWRSVLVTRR
jgi:matrixin/glucodextranase-like protein